MELLATFVKYPYPTVVKIPFTNFYIRIVARITAKI